METVQLNVRVPKHIQYQVRMRWFTDGTMPAETVVHALCETYGWSREDIEPIHGQLTVDETQQPGEDGKAGSPPDSAVASTVASRRPRAAEQAERPTGEPAGDSTPPAGCPECGGDMSELDNGDDVTVRCDDCGYGYLKVP
jgi:hypothetical protein